MAITRAQQARQMLKKGSEPVVQGGVENYLGRQPEVQAPRKWQSGPDKPPTELAYITEAEKKLLLKEDIHGSLKDGPNEGPAGIMSLDSFGDIGGAGAAGVDTDPGGGYDTGPGGGGFTGKGPNESPADFKARQAKEIAAINKIIADEEKKAKQLTEQAKKERSFLNRLKKISPFVQKGLYSVLPNNPKTEFRYIQDLKFRNPAAYDKLPDNLKALYEETEEAANEFSSYKDFDKFSFDDFKSLTDFNPGDTGAMNFADYAATYAGAPGLKFSGNVGNLEKYVTGKDEFGRTMYGYREKTDNGGPDEQIIFPKKNTVDADDSDMDDDNTQTGVTKGLALRFKKDGGRINAMDGGIMDADVVGGEFDFESARQMYGLGKLVKKVTRTVKKIAKSPVGKAALIGAAAFGIPGTSIGGLFGRASFMLPAGSSGVTGLFGTQGIAQALQLGKMKAGNLLFGLPGDTGGRVAGTGLLSKFPGGGVGAAITAVSLLPLLGLGTGDETEEEAQEILRGEGLDLQAIRDNPDQYLGRRFRAEGGSMKEPVAKKTMPLLDLDGKEMDLRAEGGFVPIGRMEKADDVPARLSKNEFVFTADAVRNAGDGDVDKGAEVMYNMMKNLESGGDVSEESQGLEGARAMFQTSKRLEEVL